MRRGCKAVMNCRVRSCSILGCTSGRMGMAAEALLPHRMALSLAQALLFLSDRPPGRQPPAVVQKILTY